MTPKDRAESGNEKNPEHDEYLKDKQKPEKESTRFFKQTVFYDWCKACGICIAFCPKNVFSRGANGKPVIDRPDECNGCLFCELHCPDFALSIEDRHPDRRRKSNDA